jgi:hypothetical protein
MLKVKADVERTEARQAVRAGSHMGLIMRSRYRAGISSAREPRRRSPGRPASEALKSPTGSLLKLKSLYQRERPPLSTET